MMHTVTPISTTLPSITEEEIGRLEPFLPTVNIISYTGPGAAGAVSTSLEPVVKRLGTRVNWFALAELPRSSDFSPTARGHLNGAGDTGFCYYEPRTSTRQLEAHQKVANGYLWNLLSGQPDHNQFDLEAWKSFRALCQSVASECITTASESFPTICWLHDYQLTLAAPVLASQTGILLSQFWHAPWPEASLMASSPIARELVEALLHNKLIGFHSERHADNFLNTVALVLPDAVVDLKKRTVSYRRRSVRVSVLPQGIDMQYWQKVAETASPGASLRKIYGLKSDVILSVDRLERSSGILEKLNAIEKLLLKEPARAKTFNYVQVSHEAKLSSEVENDYADLVTARIANINTKFGKDSWTPVMHLSGKLDHLQLAAWYQTATVFLASSNAESTGAVAKEFVACRTDDNGALVISKTLSCAREFSQGAYTTAGTSGEDLNCALLQALSATTHDINKRMISMRYVLLWNQLQNWALQFLSQALSR
jgi:trehalose 6-phosphate synthase